MVGARIGRGICPICISDPALRAMLVSYNDHTKSFNQENAETPGPVKALCLGMWPRSPNVPTVWGSAEDGAGIGVWPFGEN